MHLLIFIFIEKTKRYSYIIFNFDNIYKNLYIYIYIKKKVFNRAYDIYMYGMERQKRLY